jgi:hypothetical protein
MTEKIEMTPEQWDLFRIFTRDMETFLTSFGFVKTADGQPKRDYIDRCQDLYSDSFSGLVFSKENVRLVFSYSCPDDVWHEDDSPFIFCEFQTDETDHIKVEKHFEYFDIMGDSKWPFYYRPKDFDEFTTDFNEWFSSLKEKATQMYQRHVSHFPSARSHGKKFKIVEINDQGEIVDADVIIDRDNVLINPRNFENKIAKQVLKGKSIF